MKVATFNTNSVRIRMDAILAWLKRHAPDVLCLQETKVEDHLFPRDPFEAAGYQVHCRGMKSYNGVAILSRAKPDAVLYGFGDTDQPDEPDRKSVV